MKIAVTGISGYLGQVILPLLENNPDIDEIIGIDLKPPTPSPKLTFNQFDIRDPAVGKALQGCDVILHMAFIVMPLRKRERETDSINIDGTKNIFQQCASANVKKIVYTSSVAAYGTWPDNPIPITEDWPCRVMPDFYYSRTKAMVENWIDIFEKQYPEIAVVRLRPHIFIGPKVDNLANEAFTRDYLTAYKGHKQFFQLVWDEDVADAICLAIQKNVRGAYNIAADDWITLEQAARILNKPVKVIPFGVALFFTRLFWVLRLTKYFHPGWVKTGKYPIIVDSSKAKKDLGWKPTKTTKEIFKELIQILNIHPGKK